MRHFKDLVSSVEYHGGDIFFDKDMMENEIREDEKNNISKTTPEGYRNRTIEKSKAVAFIKSANRKIYGRLSNNICDLQSFKIDVYPKTLAEAYEMLSAHTVHSNMGTLIKGKREAKSTNNGTTTKAPNNESTNTSSAGRSYLQTEVVPGTDGRTITHITCYNCGKKGHYTNNCPKDGAEHTSSKQHVQFTDNQDINGSNGNDGEDQMLQLEGETNEIVHFSRTQLAHVNSNRYQDTDILLDTGSIFLVFKNQDMLLNVRRSNRTLKAFTNGGRQDSDQVADLPGFFAVWYNPASMINILSWAGISERFRITADTNLGKFITMHLSPSRKMIFEEVTSGLYLFRNPSMVETTSKVSGYSYLMLAEARLADFTKHQIQGVQ